jgi:hypothetical protein
MWRITSSHEPKEVSVRYEVVCDKCGVSAPASMWAAEPLQLTGPFREYLVGHHLKHACPQCAA